MACLNNYRYLLLLSVTLIGVLINSPSTAEEDDATIISNSAQPRIYRSPEERRDAGLGHQLNDWLKASGLIEIERERIDFKLADTSQISEDDGTIFNGQLAFELTLSDSISAEINIESEIEDRSHTFLDEAILKIDLEPFEIELGRISVPFGEYYSHFVTGPLLEFSETLAEGAVFSYAPLDVLDISFYAFESKVDHLGTGSFADWGVNLEVFNESESIKFGLGYLSDLAESDEQLLAEIESPSSYKVGAWNAYAVLGFEQSEITAEYVSAQEKFRQLEPELDKPSAFNIEYAYFLDQTTQIAIRYERSKDLEDAPQQQYGINFSWRPNQTILLSVEYLKGKYLNGIELDADEARKSKSFAAQIAIEF